MNSPIFNLPRTKKELIHLTEKWANINSGSENFEGLQKMAESLMEAFIPLNASFAELSLPERQIMGEKGQIIKKPLHPALHWIKRPQCKYRIFLGGHMDTVYSPTSPFQKIVSKNKDRMVGPGVADMKGGLVVLLTALLAFENSPLAKKIGWEVLINPDEEIGSPGSSHLFKAIAKRNHFGLLFEPSFPDGSFVGQRKGSLSIALSAKGVAAHAGRDFHKGKNALTALAKVLLKLESFTNPKKETTVNVGFFQGGGAVNQVPDSAIAQINIRAKEEKELQAFKQLLTDSLKKSEEGIHISSHIDSYAPPKPFDKDLKVLFDRLQFSAEELGINFALTSSGGTCDGARLYALGLLNIDTMGVVGGHLHSYEEYIELDSLVERARLTTHFLLSLAQEL